MTTGQIVNINCARIYKCSIDLKELNNKDSQEFYEYQYCTLYTIQCTVHILLTISCSGMPVLIQLFYTMFMYVPVVCPVEPQTNQPISCNKIKFAKKLP